jgi:alanine racemase
LNESLKNIANVIGANAEGSNVEITQILTDSRKVNAAAKSLFFALKGPRHNGHDYIPVLYDKGVRYFVVSEILDVTLFPGALFMQVTDTLDALQKISAHHRKKFHYPVIGITGSNGKTIVKEWIWQVLSTDLKIVRSPKSYNSQVGVPLSVWQMNEQHNLAIFEAGISEPGEMGKIKKITQPTIGVMTNIGEAHSRGFQDKLQKAIEKISLFQDSEVIIYSADQPVVCDAIDNILNDEDRMFHGDLFSWGRSEKNTLKITSIEKTKTSTLIKAQYQQQTIDIEIPFTDDASVENSITCWCVCLYLGVPATTIHQRMKELLVVNMRLELKKGINNCTIINDSYSADSNSLNMALDFLNQQGGSGKKTVILSDLVQSGLANADLYAQVAGYLYDHQVDRVIGIGPSISMHLEFSAFNKKNEPMLIFFESVDAFKENFRQSLFKDETILVKGARIFEFEKIVRLLEKKLHQTVLEIDLRAMANNINQFRQMLKPGTRVMAMVKAFAYGSGGVEIASVLQYHKVDYLCVAYADEGVTLRQAGIQLPIIVLNVEENSFDAIISQNLEPVIFSAPLLQVFNHYLDMQGLNDWPIHLEIETGMNRLGFTIDELPGLSIYLQQPFVKVQSIFSHLASSEDSKDDAFTDNQYSLFKIAADIIQSILPYPFFQHISNTASVIRHPHLQMDMVRLGIGMYGINPTNDIAIELETVATLKSTIAQIKKIKPGETVGYNRKGKVSEETLIATVRIGYADGFPRTLGNGAGSMLVKGQLAPVIGIVCMDMTMIDISHIPGVKEGDEVIIFGKDLTVQQLALWAQTIPYELMTGISERVQRVYFEE